MFRLVRRPLTDLLEGRRIDMPMRDAASRDAASRAVEGPNVGDDAGPAPAAAASSLRVVARSRAAGRLEAMTSDID
jgi:hypothetical protein